MNHARLATLPKFQDITPSLLTTPNQFTSLETLADFCKFINTLAEKSSMHDYNRPLDQYLRALWGCIQKNSHISLSFGLLAQMLDDALIVEPVPFREAWLLFKRPPDLFTPDSQEDCFGNLCGMLLYQIADLQRMASAGILLLPAEELEFGFTTPTGNRWTNFSLSSFLASAACLLRVRPTVATCDWNFLSLFLWLGQNF